MSHNFPSCTVLSQSPVQFSDRDPLAVPIVQSTTYVQDSLPSSPGHAYSRVSNPTVDELERVLGDLENAPHSVCFSSGLAAETAFFLATLTAGDHIILSQAIYGGTVRLVRELLSSFGVEASFVDSTKPQRVADAIRPNTRVIFLETPANPTLELTDIRAICSLAEPYDILVAVDNTFLTPVLQQPLDLGAHVSVYSTTKHIEGHSVALGGAVTTRDSDLAEQLRFVRKSTGSIQTPHNAWLTRQGIKTLPLRIERHSANAQQVAEWLDACNEVKLVNYPGLRNSPGYRLGQQQHQGGQGGVLSFEFVGGFEFAQQFLQHVRIGRLVEHVGGLETLFTHSASMTHADVPQQQLESIGVSPGLIRVSVGIEEPEAIIADIRQAIEAIDKPQRFNGTVRREPCTV